MDQERADAELKAREIGVRLGLDAEALDSFGGMSDGELRLAIARLRIQERSCSSSRWSEPQRETLAALGDRLMALGILDEGAGLTDVEAHLRDELLIEVAGDGLVEVDKLDRAVADVIGTRSVALYHHTSSALLPLIAEHGLLIGKQTNFFNTQAGVYLSTRRAGEPVAIYARRAARVHGGEPTTLRVRRTLSQIRPDPDDADLDWAQGVQFISGPVPVGDVLLGSGGAPVAVPAGSLEGCRVVGVSRPKARSR